MKYPVYRSLDKPNAFFGMRGRFSTLFFKGLGAALFAALMVGAYAGGLVGLVVFLAGGVAAYLFVLGRQGRMSERMYARREVLPLLKDAYIRVKPHRVCSIWKHYGDSIEE